MRFFRLSLLTGGILIIYLPTLVLIYAAMNDSQFLGTDFRGFTLRWLLETLEDARFRRALVLSFLMSVWVGSLTTAVGTALALAFHTGARWLRAAILVSVAAAFLTPPTAYALNLLVVARWIGMEKGPLVTSIGQTAYALPAVVVLLILALRGVSWDRFEAAVLLGAKPLAAFYWFVLREIRGVALAGFLLAIFFSLDDLVMGVYLSRAGSDPSVTTLVWQAMRSDLSPKVAWYSLALTVTGLMISVFAGRSLVRNSPPT